MTATATKIDHYTWITADIVRQLENSVHPWHQPWKMKHAAGRISRPDFHDRMPVILSEGHWEQWLSPKTTVAEAEKMLLPFGGELKATLNERKAVVKKEKKT